MSDSGVPTVDDTRGIVAPDAMLRVVDFDRYEAGPTLDGLVEWFWSVAWNLPPGRVHDQQVLNHPAGNISVGTLDDSGAPLNPPEGRVYGVLSGLSHRKLTGAGWTVAARTTVGGLGALAGRPARELADRQIELGEGLAGVDADLAVRQVTGPADTGGRVEQLRSVLEAVVDRRDPKLIEEARRVARLASVAEHDRSVCRVEHLARAGGVSVRTVQRLFDLHVGASPAFVIRRWRIIEAAEAAKRAKGDGREWNGWAAVAAELGYADQAHLSRDFKHHLGTTPASYSRS